MICSCSVCWVFDRLLQGLDLLMVLRVEPKRFAKLLIPQCVLLIESLTLTWFLVQIRIRLVNLTPKFLPFQAFLN